MKKVTLVVYQNYIEAVIKKIHESELFQIINISKDEPELLNDTEKASVFSDSEICANYELRLSRIIDILKEINPKPSGIKSKLLDDYIIDQEIKWHPKTSLKEGIKQTYEWFKEMQEE